MHIRVPYILLLATLAFASSPRPEPDEWNIPEAVSHRAARDLAPTYRLVAHLNPFYLRADFDGDGRVDYALLIEQKSSGKVGIAVFFNKRSGRPLQILGAGKPFNFDSSNGDDFSFMDAWQVHEIGLVGQGATKAAPPRLLGDAILVEKKEAGSGLVYWDGRRFRWYQQGD